MKLRSIKIDKKFIPEFNENKKLPVNEQVVIYFNRIPGTAEKSNYKDFKFDSKGGVQLVYNDQLLISSHVERIENFEIEVDNETKFIKTGIELVNINNPALSDLYTEIRDYLFPDNEDFSAGESGA